MSMPFTTITKEIQWNMGHRIPNHKSKCKNIHGHRYKLLAEFEAPICKIKGDSSEGMVVDFSDVKQLLMKYVHDELDHGFMWYTNDEMMITFFNKNRSQKNIRVSFIPTAENIANWLFIIIESELIKIPSLKHVKLKTITIFETPTSSATVKFN